MAGPKTETSDNSKLSPRLPLPFPFPFSFPFPFPWHFKATCVEMVPGPFFLALLIRHKDTQRHISDLFNTKYIYNICRASACTHFCITLILSDVSTCRDWIQVVLISASKTPKQKSTNCCSSAACTTHSPDFSGTPHLTYYIYLENPWKIRDGSSWKSFLPHPRCRENDGSSFIFC